MTQMNSANPLVQGLAYLLFGSCMTYNDNTSEESSVANLQQVCLHATPNPPSPFPPPPPKKK